MYSGTTPVRKSARGGAHTSIPSVTRSSGSVASAAKPDSFGIWLSLALEHDSERRIPVFRKDHAPEKKRDVRVRDFCDTINAARSRPDQAQLPPALARLPAGSHPSRHAATAAGPAPAARR